MLLDAQQPSVLQDYLRRRGWLDNQEVISTIETPGGGTMNCLLRVITPFRSLIVKQSRAYVEKYSASPAPADRTVIEGRFYQEVQPIPMIAGVMPLLMGVDRENNILVLEDIGNVRDYTFLYQPDERLSEEDTVILTNYLSELHYHFTAQVPGPLFDNRAMRELNHELIFNTPYLEPGTVDLDSLQPGLTELAASIKRDITLKKAIRQLGQLYLSESFPAQPGMAFGTGTSKTLLHGDFCPESWLQTEAHGLKIIDPEFCFYGPAEFDIGVLIAHLMLARQPNTVIDRILSTYERPAGFDEGVRQRFTAAEIIRRVIGPTQLPLSLSIEQRQSLLQESRQMML